MRIGVPKSGSSGTYFLTGSSIESLPSCASRVMAAAVNCFATEPDSNTVRRPDADAVLQVGHAVPPGMDDLAALGHADGAPGRAAPIPALEDLVDGGRRDGRGLLRLRRRADLRPRERR